MLHHDRAARPHFRLRWLAGTFAGPFAGMSLALAAGTTVAAAQPVAAIAPAPGTDAARMGGPSATQAGAQVGAPTGAPSGAQTSAGALQTTLGKERASRVENHIASLHAALKITPAQDPLWQTFAATMRQNAVQMDQVYARRQSGYGAMTAVQDLQSYSDVENANAHNVQLLLPPFEALYDSFTPEQKKTADTTFLRYTDRAVKKSN